MSCIGPKETLYTKLSLQIALYVALTPSFPTRHHPHQTKGTKPILLPEIGQEMPADESGAKRLVRT